MTKPLTTEQLREEVIRLVEYAKKGDGTVPVSNVIMAAIKDHVVYIIGEDFPLIPSGITNQPSDAVLAVNHEKAEQRNRAGAY